MTGSITTSPPVIELPPGSSPGGTPVAIYAIPPAGMAPGGVTTQLQYNNAGNFAGAAGATYDGVNLNLANAPTAPTAAPGTNTQQIATTAFVMAATPAGARTILAANTTYYVLATGSDSNTGLVNTAAGAFLTIAKALAAVAALDCGIYVPTIQVGAGTWTVPVVLPKIVGSATPVFSGIGSTTLLSTTSADCITNAGSGIWLVTNLKMTVAVVGNGITAKLGGTIQFSGVEFGACASYQAIAYPSSTIQATGAITISGGANIGFMALGGYVDLHAQTITYSGAPAYFAENFACSAGYFDAWSMTFAGTFASVTGTRYLSTNMGLIFTNGGGASYIPGSVAGAASASATGVYA